MEQDMKASILVVDDSELSLEQMRKFLEKTAYTADFAVNASSAVIKLRESDYDIVITDKNMPGLHPGSDEGGMELLHILQNDFPDTEVIMMTGYATIETAIEAMRLGAFDYLVKPFTREDLLECISRLMEYRAFINPKNTISIYKNIHNEILELIERQKNIDDMESHLRLKSIDEKIDHFFEAQKNWERIILEQREALAGIIPLAERLREMLPDDGEEQKLIREILQNADRRL